MSEHDSTCDNSSLPVVNGVEFRPIDGFPGYCVGDDGSLWSKRHKNGIPSPTWRRMSPGIGPKGYAVAVMRHTSQRRRAVRMSRLVLTAFDSPPPYPNSEACHRDGNRSNDALSNLRWDSPSGNQRDRLGHGTHNRGEMSGRAKLTRKHVLVIRARLDRGELGSAIARDYGVDVHTIYGIKHRRTWSWL